MKEKLVRYTAVVLTLTLLIGGGVFLSPQNIKQTVALDVSHLSANVLSLFAKPEPVVETTLYTGKVYNIFFHSLVIYPKLAFDGSIKSELYQNYMITRDEFEKILPQLYLNNFILIDPSLLYQVNPDGSVSPKPLYLPKGKRPLIISLDDLSYYSTMKGHGFADKLVLDANEDVATEVVTPEGTTEVTRDGDVIPLLDDFVTKFPDFSWNGAKGVIALTGYEGVLGYRTNDMQSATYAQDVQSAKNVIAKLKSIGWQFASHSYSHDKSFSTGVISLSDVQKDTELWDAQVKPLVGDTNMFIGPYGQIFKPGDARREYLINHGFKALFGVGMDMYFNYFPNALVMDRADIDGYRLLRTPHFLNTYFDPTNLSDPLRENK